MIPGPYCICHVVFGEKSDSDVPTYRVLRYGYDTAESAYKNIDAVASDEDVPASECTVIRQIEREEVNEFKA